jgi:hypothetical protein
MEAPGRRNVRGAKKTMNDPDCKQETQEEQKKQAIW